jgi:aerobic carbon-monoxide dehydrogenase large subunit
MGEFGIGQPVRRKEDMRLLLGKGEFTDDINLDDQLYAAFVRSPHSSAKIIAINATAALAMEGVVAVYTGRDLVAADIGPLIVSDADFKDRSGRPMSKPLRQVMPTERTRFVGEALAMVVALTPVLARDAADCVEIEFEPLDALASAAHALEPGAPRVWPEFDNNLVVHWEHGDRADVEGKLANADKTVEVELINNRLVASPMEPRVVAAEFDDATGVLTVFAPTQGGRRIQSTLARQVFKVDPVKVRIVSRDTGGGFGNRSKTYPETVVVAFAAKTLGRPVKWCGDRSETFLSDYHGRDQINFARMGFDTNGKIIAMSLETILNVGAYLSEIGVRIPIEGGGRILPGAYHVPDFYYSVKPVFTNTVCTDTYRGAGRPEANYVMERLMDAGALALGMPRDEIRRRNFITPDQMPYRTHLGFTYDSGDFTGTLNMALEAADWKGFEARREQSAKRGKRRGIGIGSFIEGAGYFPIEGMRMRFEEDGDVTLFAGTYSHGQGHATVYSQLVNELLGVDFDKVKLVNGDTATSPETSIGTFGSRSSMVGSMCVKRAAEAIIAKGKEIAAQLLQSDADRIVFEAGEFRSSTSSVSLTEVAKASRDPRKIPEGMPLGFDETVTFKNDVENFPNGTHVCELEVDPETGVIEILDYVAVDDCGVVLNPLIVHGQIHGGVAQGVGQALTENVVYDGSGQLLTASYMDYGMPRAADMPGMKALFNPVPAKTNELGVKGAGEAGCCGPPPALVSAVSDALSDYGVSHIDMPLSPERVWRAIQESKAGRTA